jgi:hypothetical protein
MEEVNHDRIQAASLFFNSLLVASLVNLLRWKLLTA